MNGRPADRGHDFERLICISGTVSPITSGLMWWITPALLPCVKPMSNHVGAELPIVASGVCRLRGVTNFPPTFLGNGWADCVDIWYAIGVPLVAVHAIVMGGVSLHVPTCTPCFCISGTAWPIVFKFGVWVGDH